MRRGGAPERQRLDDPTAADALGISRAIEELHGMCDEAVLGDLIDLALMNIESEQDALACAGLEADYERMRKAAHKLSGVLAQYGAGEVARLASLFERAEEATLRDELGEFARRIELSHAQLKAARAQFAA